MMMNKFILGVLILFSFTVIQAQEAAEGEFFTVTFDDFTPPTQDLINSFEGKEPMPFMANDIYGVEHYLKNYQGKVVFIYFWNGDCIDCLAQISSLNLLHKEEKEKLQIVSFVDEAKADALNLAQVNGVEFPVLPQGRLIGEMAYGIELGYPRLFALDTSGKVVHIFPEAALTGQKDIYLPLKDVLQKISNK